MRRAAAVLAVLAMASLAHSETFYSKITKVEGNKVTYQKIILGKPGKIFDPATSEAVKTVLVRETTKVKKDAELLKDGLANAVFKNIDDKGLRAWITTADVGEDIGKITEITIRSYK